MLKNITLGQYFPGTSIIHRLDPRIKLILIMVYVVMIFFVQSFLGYAIIALTFFGCVKLSKISLSYYLKGLKALMYIILITFTLNIFMNKGEGDPLVSFWIIEVYIEGLRFAAFMGLRLTFLILGTQILTLTTSPLSLTDGIESLLNPLKKIKFPVHELAMMMTIALRFIPTLLSETDRIMKAQLSRGADFETGNILKKAKNMIPILVPLFISAFRRADELALAMESRCYRGSHGRTRMKVLKLTRVDLYASFAWLAFVCIILYDYIIGLNSWFA